MHTRVGYLSMKNGMDLGLFYMLGYLFIMYVRMCYTDTVGLCVCVVRM